MGYPFGQGGSGGQAEGVRHSPFQQLVRDIPEERDKAEQSC